MEEKIMEENIASQEPISKTGDRSANINTPGNSRSFASRNRLLFIIAGALITVVILSVIFWPHKRGEQSTNQTANQEAKEGEAGESANEVALKPEQLTAADIKLEEVVQRPVSEALKVTGTVEANQQQTQDITPLISGRVDRVNVLLGNPVGKGEVLAVISSPVIAEKHGKLHEAETKLLLAERNLAQIKQPESRVGVLSAKAKLEESEAALRRANRLIELGAGAGKDLIAAETAYKTAKAEYDFQSNISLNREVLQAQADVETAKVEVSHLRNELRSLGAVVPEKEGTTNSHDISVVALSAPISGTITDRKVNAGAGIEAGKPLFTITNLSNVWVIANVPEAQVNQLRISTPAEIHFATTGQEVLTGHITYIDSTLNEETRTARVRIEVANAGEKLKVGTFVEVTFQVTGKVVTTNSEAILIPSTAIQHIGDRTIVFVPKGGESGHFEARDIELGNESNGFSRVTKGLALGDRIVTKGGFTLKTQLMKGQLGEE